MIRKVLIRLWSSTLMMTSANRSLFNTVAPQTVKTGTHLASALYIHLIKQSSRRCRQFQLQQSHLLSFLSVAAAFAYAVALLICAAKDHLAAIQSIMFMRSTLPSFTMLRRNIIPDPGHVPDPDPDQGLDQDLDLDPIAID